MNAPESDSEFSVQPSTRKGSPRGSNRSSEYLQLAGGFVELLVELDFAADVERRALLERRQRRLQLHVLLRQPLRELEQLRLFGEAAVHRHLPFGVALAHLLHLLLVRCQPLTLPAIG